MERLRFKDNGNQFPSWQKWPLYDLVKYMKSSRKEDLQKELENGYALFGTKGVIKYIESYDVLSKAIGIVQWGASAANLIKLPERSSVVWTMGYLIPKTSRLNTEFAYYYLSKQRLSRYINTSTVPNLYFKDFQHIKLSTPSYKEQEKIGNFLSLFDRLLEKINEKIDLLKELKKGYLQQMFPAKSEKVPKIRFSGFNDEWSKRSISDLFDYIRPDRFIVTNEEYSNEFKTPVLTANKAFILGYTNENNTFNDPSIIFDDFTLDCKFVDFPYMVKSSAIKILTAKTGSDLKFSFELLNSTRFENLGHARHYISIVQNKNVIVPTLIEQEKIGNFLSSLDKQIENTKSYSNEVESLKKGYMQRLFA
jgi:type I restriction enzyme S subunit